MESARKRRRVWYEKAIQDVKRNTPTAFEFLHPLTASTTGDVVATVVATPATTTTTEDDVIRMCQDMGTHLCPTTDAWSKQAHEAWFTPLATQAFGLESEFGFLAHLGLGRLQDVKQYFVVEPAIVQHTVQRLVFWALVGGRCDARFGNDATVNWQQVRHHVDRASDCASRCFHLTNERQQQQQHHSWSTIMPWLDKDMRAVEECPQTPFSMHLDGAKLTALEVSVLQIDTSDIAAVFAADAATRGVGSWLGLLRTHVFTDKLVHRFTNSSDLVHLWNNIKIDWLKKWFVIQFALLLNMCRVRTLFSKFADAHALVHSRLLRKSASLVYLHETTRILAEEEKSASRVHLHATTKTLAKEEQKADQHIASQFTTLEWKSSFVLGENVCSTPALSYKLKVAPDHITVCFPTTTETFLPVTTIQDLGWTSFKKNSGDLLQHVHKVRPGGVVLTCPAEIETRHSTHIMGDNMLLSTCTLVSNKWTGVLRTGKGSSRKIVVWLEVTVRYVSFIIRHMLQTHLRNISFQNPVIPLIMDYL